MDALDRTIVALLQENARLTNREIAARVGSTEPTVRRRVTRLLDTKLMRIVAVATPFDLGYQLVAILGIQLDQSKLSGIGEALVPMREIRFAGITAGPYDIVVEVWFESTEQLVSFIADRLKRIPGIQRVESIQVLRLLKYSYDWGTQPSAALKPGTNPRSRGARVVSPTRPRRRGVAGELLRAPRRRGTAAGARDRLTGAAT